MLSSQADARRQDWCGLRWSFGDRALPCSFSWPECHREGGSGKMIGLLFLKLSTSFLRC